MAGSRCLIYVPTAEMNVGDSARLSADEGEYERRTRNRAVMSKEGKRVVKLEIMYKRRFTTLTVVFRE